MARKAAPRKTVAPASLPVSKRTGKPLTAAYAARIARGRAKGKTDQQARGHKEHEHVERRQKERIRSEMLGTLTSQDKQFAKRWGREIHKQLDMSPEAAADAALKRMSRLGAPQFRAYVARIKAERQQYRRQEKRGSWISKGEGYLKSLAEDFGDDEPQEIMWYFYH